MMFKRAVSLFLALSMMVCMMPMEALAETDSVSDSLGVAALDSAEKKINEQGATFEE